jgi:hypothetical protein
MNAIIVLSILAIYGAAGVACCRLTNALERREPSQTVCVKQRVSPAVIYVHRQRRKAQTAAVGINADVDASLVWTPKKPSFSAGLPFSHPI